MTQKELAVRAGLPQSTVARIESGHVDPRVSTLEKLLRVCGSRLSLEPALRADVYGGVDLGVDRTMIRELRKLSPRERLELLAEEARNLDRLTVKRSK